MKIFQQHLIIFMILNFSALATAFAAEEVLVDTDKATESVYSLSLKDSEALALQYSHALHASRLNREVASGRIMSAWGTALPQVWAEASNEFRDDYNTKNDHDRFKKTYRGSINVTQPLFKGGKIGAALRGARLYRKNVNEGIRQTRQEILYQVRILYYAILFDQELVRVAREQLDYATRYLEDMKKRKEMEVATEYDVLRAEVEQTNNETELLNSRNALQTDKSSFLNLLGLPMTSSLELSDKLKFADRETASRRELYRQALVYRPEVRSAELNILMQQEDIRSTRGDLLPQFSLTGNFNRSTNDFGSNIGDWTPDWYAGVLMRWTIFDGLMVRGQLKEKKAIKEQLQYNKKTIDDSVRLEVQTALLDIENARQSVLSQKKNVTKSRESLRLTHVREREGVATHLDVLNARQTLAEAQRFYYEANYHYNVAWAELSLAIGVLGEEQDPSRVDSIKSAPDAREIAGEQQK